jgi:hypothetical protein
MGVVNTSPVRASDLAQALERASLHDVFDYDPPPAINLMAFSDVFPRKTEVQEMVSTVSLSCFPCAESSKALSYRQRLMLDSGFHQF